MCHELVFFVRATSVESSQYPPEHPRDLLKRSEGIFLYKNGPELAISSAGLKTR